MARVIKLIVPAGKGKPSPQIGQSLGSVGLNMMAFLKEFNAKSMSYKEEVPLKVDLHCTPGNPKFEFGLRMPATSWMIKKALGIEKGAHTPGTEVVGTIHVKTIYAIAELKLREQKGNGDTMEGMCRRIVGQCQSMGIKVDGSRES